jgi:hypothetical protein
MEKHPWSYDPGVVVGDSDRERAVAELREHFASGRLTLDEFSTRTERALAARSRSDLRATLAGLPLTPDHLVERGRAVASMFGRFAALVVFTAAYLVFSLLLVLALVLTMVIHGASPVALLAFLGVWLVPTYLLSRLWHLPGRASRYARR